MQKTFKNVRHECIHICTIRRKQLKIINLCLLRCNLLKHTHSHTCNCTLTHSLTHNNTHKHIHAHIHNKHIYTHSLTRIHLPIVTTHIPIAIYASTAFPNTCIHLHLHICDVQHVTCLNIHARTIAIQTQIKTSTHQKCILRHFAKTSKLLSCPEMRTD